jgi:hypothetical protein
VLIEQFKTLGFVVKRGLIPRETLQPWVDKLWQTVDEQTDLFNATLSRDDPSTWHDVGERWTNFTNSGHGRDLIHLTPNSQWRWCGRTTIELPPRALRATQPFSH